jgi:hypothetical protein
MIMPHARPHLVFPLTDGAAAQIAADATHGLLLGTGAALSIAGWITDDTH